LEQSFFIAKLLGPVLTAAAIPMIVNPNYLKEIANEFLKARALIYITGVMVMLGGLSIVNKHNIWVMGWPVMITLFGWAMIIGGAFRVVLPSAVMSIGGSMLEKSIMTRILGVVWLFVGAYLSYKGYFCNA
jgi:hypothetical protein